MSIKLTRLRFFNTCSIEWDTTSFKSSLMKKQDHELTPLGLEHFLSSESINGIGLRITINNGLVPVYDDVT